MLKIPVKHLLKGDYTAFYRKHGHQGERGGGGRGRGEGNFIVFHLRSLTHSACQYDVTY